MCSHNGMSLANVFDGFFAHVAGFYIPCGADLGSKLFARPQQNVHPKSLKKKAQRHLKLAQKLQGVKVFS